MTAASTPPSFSESHVNLGFDLVRATEAAALAAGRYIGLGLGAEADRVASQTMLQELNRVPFEGHIVGRAHRNLEKSPAASLDAPIGTGKGPSMDVVYDVVDGINLLSEGRAGAISVISAVPRHTMWNPEPALYMQKIVVDRRMGRALVPECLDAPPGWVLALVARELGKSISDLVVFVLDRPRHTHLLSEIRQAGARAQIRSEGDIAGALLASQLDSPIDVLMGIGGAIEGLIAAVGVRALGGTMVARLTPQSQTERDEIIAAGHDLGRVHTTNDLVQSDAIFFAATGVTSGQVLRGVSYAGQRAYSHSLIIRGESGITRYVQTEHPAHAMPGAA